MKKAFTFLELVFVIVVIGILAATIIPEMKTNSLYEAASQLVGHIRYTQHLAMVDDKFDDSDEEWYKTRWQIKFSKVSGSDNKWAYAIFQDINKDGNPNASETAVNPLDTTKRLTGGYSGTIEYDEKEATKELNLGNKYSIFDIDFSDCGINNDDGKKRIFFDAMGRPYSNNPKSLDSVYKDGTDSFLLDKSCKVIICSVDDCSSANNEEKVTIQIEKETGYIHIL